MLFIIFYLMLTFATCKWIISNLANTMKAKITPNVSVGNLSQLDTLIAKQTKNVWKIWHIIVK